MESKEIWVVFDEEGWPMYCAGWPEACHEHINDALNDKYIDAGKWVVRQCKIIEPISQ